VHQHHKVKEWLSQQQGRVHFVFTPTRASWLNQIELWFSLLTHKVIRRGIFASKEELVHTIVRFIEKYSVDAKPFQWTCTGEPPKSLSVSRKLRSAGPRPASPWTPRAILRSRGRCLTGL